MDLDRTSVSDLGRALLATVHEQVQTAANTPTVEAPSVRVHIVEEKTLVVGAGGYNLIDSTGNVDISSARSFLQDTREAACTGIVGTCAAVLANTTLRRRLLLISRRLQSSNTSAKATVDLAREFDFGTSVNASKPVEELIASALADHGVEVTSSTTTRLDATSTVTTVGEMGQNTAVTIALSESILSTKLSEKLPTVNLAISSAVIAPPALPPNMPPHTALYPPPPLHVLVHVPVSVNVTDAGDAFSVVAPSTVTVAIAMTLAAVCIALALGIVSLVYWGNRKRGEEQIYPFQPAAPHSCYGTGVRSRVVVLATSGVPLEAARKPMLECSGSVDTSTQTEREASKQGPASDTATFTLHTRPITTALSLVYPTTPQSDEPSSSQAVLAAILAQADEDGWSEDTMQQRIPIPSEQLEAAGRPRRVASTPSTGRTGMVIATDRPSPRQMTSRQHGPGNALGSSPVRPNTPDVSKRLRAQAEQRWKDFRSESSIPSRRTGINKMLAARFAVGAAQQVLPPIRKTPCAPGAPGMASEPDSDRERD